MGETGGFGGAPGTGGRPQSGAAGDRSSRLALRNWRVRSRLLLLIAIPTLTAVALGGVRIATSVHSALAYQRVLQLANLSSDITVLTQRLEDERDQLAYFIALPRGGRGSANGPGGPPGSAANNAQVDGQEELQKVVLGQQQLTNRALGVVKADLAQIGPAFPAQVRAEATTALSELGGPLAALRSQAVTSNLPGLVVVQKYATIINDLLILEDSTAQGSSDTQLAQNVRVLGLVSQMKQDASEQRAILTAALLTQDLSPAESQALTNAQSDQQANLGEFNLSATSAQQALWTRSGSGAAGYQAPADELQAQSIAQANGGSLRQDTGTTADDWYGAMTHTINYQLGAVERSLVRGITDRAAALRNAAVTQALAIGLAVLVVLALALLFTVVVVRSMVRPLRRLRAGALQVAGERLPETVRQMSEGEAGDAPLDVEPIAVDSADEIGEVARAFDQVHREAVRLAANEAALRGNVNAMFVNLSRRSQSLVERQIRLIDDLEQGEQDPERLANLFQMDHLATRMRRNSENLLVLAGHELTRRRTEPVPLVDVLRAAVSEIEQYERITLTVQPGLAVRGPAVNDVVHLLAELAENATSFSAADTPVNISGHLLNSGGVLLDITDQGVGMHAEEMAHANWRLDNPPVVDVAVSRRMGLFVVARLAARHGIRVRLRPSPRGGLTALVWLPDEVITHETQVTPPGLRRFDLPGTADTSGTVPAWPTTDDRSAAVEAVTAARAPRFTPLRPDTADTGSFGAIGADDPAAAGAGGSERDLVGAGTDGAGTDGASTARAAASRAGAGAGLAGAFDAGADADGGVDDGGGAAAADAGEPLQPAVDGPLPVFGVPFTGPAAGLPDGPDGRDEPALPTSRSEPAEPLPVRIPRADPLPVRIPPAELQRSVIVPPAVSSSEENRLPIFESVESDWFRRGRHGADRPTPVESPAEVAWSSPADEGWRAAETVSAPVAGGVTVAGLPKRVPQANLVPGAVGGAPAAAPPPSRSAAQARERLSSFQRGVREGRVAARESEESDGEDDGAT